MSGHSSVEREGTIWNEVICLKAGVSHVLPFSLSVYASITKNNLDFQGYIEKPLWYCGTANRLLQILP